MLGQTYRLIRIYFITVVLLGFNSCTKNETIEFKDQEATLEVRVTGTLSGNPRDNITVAIYSTESDADNRKSAVKGGQKTDGDGKTLFKGLIQNKRYWVRADAILSKKIKQTNSLDRGENTFDIDLL